MDFPQLLPTVNATLEGNWSSSQTYLNSDPGFTLFTVSLIAVAALVVVLVIGVYCHPLKKEDEENK